ncbi:MAG: hypothetical protein IKJ67_08505 [Bacteroidales bacterium]|nr:hypothetical protein [Bacteroidales bacterium]
MSKFSLAESLHKLSAWTKNKYAGYIEKYKKTSITMKMYYDSPLGSKHEKDVEESFAFSTYQAVKDFLPSGLPDSVSKFLGAKIASFTIKKMNSQKLNYQYAKDLITEDKYHRESAKRFVSATVAVVNKTWSFIGIGVKKKLDDIGVPEKVSKYLWATVTTLKKPISDFCKENKVKDRVVNAVHKATGTVIKTAKNVVEKIDNAIDTVRESTKNFVDNFAQKLGYSDRKELKTDLKEKAKEYTKSVIDTGKKEVKKIFNFITGRR